MSAKLVVGIDLGTTHTVVASFAIADAARKDVAPTVLHIPQLVSASETESRALLPSCLYAPIAGEITGDPQFVLGEFARRRGSEVAGRFVLSAKSWLCHAGVDRLAPILPWGADDETAPRISPLAASTRYLAFVRDAWNDAHPDAPLAEQDVVLTVPASFDEIARELTLRAATDAGLTVSLLEEPTAAFYDAMRAGKKDTAWKSILNAKNKIEGEEKFVLVCDVGGGTTDLALMAVGKTIRRIATGRHILLGGDNMDLALAHLAESRISPHQALSAVELAQLVLACRAAKELIFSGKDEARVALLGRGTKLVGGARAATITRADVDDVVLAGFFPSVARDESSPRVRSGLVSFGLPYERDAAITRHVAQFLARHASDMNGRAPDALLLNGGVFRAKAIETALTGIVRAWSPAHEVVLLPNADPDLAVARGAVIYGFSRRGKGVRVESGAARGYYVALGEDAENQARAVCILPRGADEGVFYEAKDRAFDLVVGQSVRFDVYASDVAKDEAGAIVTLPSTGDGENSGAMEKLSRVVARLDAQDKDERTIAVTLGGELLATGQLALSCLDAKDPARRFRLEFQLRGDVTPQRSSLPPPKSIAPQSAISSSNFPRAKLDEAQKLLERVFGKRADADPREAKDLVRDLERVLGEKNTWTMDLARALADTLLANPGARRRTANHERAFFMLAGFCLRPGFGDASDAERMRVFSTLFDARLAFPEEPRAFQQFFIAWRRTAGGLDENTQLKIRDAMDPMIAPKEANLKKPKRMPDSPDELVQLLAALERVPASRRAELGEWLIERTWVDKDARLWSAIARIGARVPIYAAVNHVVAPSSAEAWVTRLLREKWGDLQTAPHAAVQLARVTGDRARDLRETVRIEVEKKLAQANAKPSWLRAVRELVDVDDEEKVAVLGEGLPIGLRLTAT